jgi:hypothetical protein
VKGIERVKSAQSKPNPLPNAFPNYVTRACKKREGDAHGSLFERKILMKSPEPGNNKLSVKIMSENYP